MCDFFGDHILHIAFVLDFLEAHILHIVFVLTLFGLAGLGRYLIFLSVKFIVECTQHHVWGPLGARVMSIFVNTYVVVKVEFGVIALGSAA